RARTSISSTRSQRAPPSVETYTPSPGTPQKTLPLGRVTRSSMCLPGSELLACSHRLSCSDSSTTPSTVPTHSFRCVPIFLASAPFGREYSKCRLPRLCRRLPYRLPLACPRPAAAAPAGCGQSRTGEESHAVLWNDLREYI